SRRVRVAATVAHGRPRGVPANVRRVPPTTTLDIPVTTYPLERFTLPNGLRVVLAPDRSAPVIAVAVLYDVGIRSEPPGRTGFAHLFEHLMFQGSANLEKLAHFRIVQSEERRVGKGGRAPWWLVR